jgi:hypothetical protein
MPIAVVCSNCSARLNAPDGAAGKKVKCPKCQSPIVVPDIQPMQFEVVEDEPAPARRPAGKPTRVKAAVEDDDDDRPRRKRRSEEEEDDEDDDDLPRKKKRRKGGDEEGGVSMTRNIVMGVVLIILVAVAAYIFYERSQKQKEADQQKSSSNANVVDANAPDHPSRNMPLPTGDVVPPSNIGNGPINRLVQNALTADPELMNVPRQKVVIGPYQLMLPEKLVRMEDASKDPTQMALWVARVYWGKPTVSLVIFVIDDAELVKEARKDMREALYSITIALERKTELRIDGRELAETCEINGLRFTRFVITGRMPNELRMRGRVYGAIDENRLVAIVGMGFGGTAPVATKLLDDIVGTFKKT